MGIVQYKKDNGVLHIYGTNQVADLFISAFIVPIKGMHGGAYLAARKIWRKEKDWIMGECVQVTGFSMGASIAGCLSKISHNDGWIIPFKIKAPFHFTIYPYKDQHSSIEIYGNDPVPGLFRPFYSFPDCKIIHTGPPRKWWKVFFLLAIRDHVRY